MLMLRVDFIFFSTILAKRKGESASNRLEIGLVESSSDRFGSPNRLGPRADRYD